VFGIAITLLILEIRLPDIHELHSSGGLWPVLWQRWPSYLGYVLSFLVIGFMWANHHALFVYIRRLARALILSNLLLMMGLAFVPFPTAILAEHLTDPETRTAATVFYGATLVYTSLAFNALWWTGRWRRRLLGKDVADEGVRTITRGYTAALFCYSAATALAFVNVWLSLGVHLVLALWNALSKRAWPQSACGCIKAGRAG
jgi:uncharacterized membrane protein